MLISIILNLTTTLFFSIGERIGIEYLYSQIGESLTNYQEAVRILSEDTDTEEQEDSGDLDEGFAELQEEEMLDPTIPTSAVVVPVSQDEHLTQETAYISPPRPILRIPSNNKYKKLMEQTDQGFN